MTIFLILTNIVNIKMTHQELFVLKKPLEILILETLFNSENPLLEILSCLQEMQSPLPDFTHYDLHKPNNNDSTFYKVNSWIGMSKSKLSDLMEYAFGEYFKSDE